MKIQFPYSVRCAHRVADAVSTEISGLTNKYGGEYLPSLLSIRGRNDAPIFHYEGGIVVQVHLVDLDLFTESWRDRGQDWVVTSVTVRYYAVLGAYVPPKISEEWGAEKLLSLKDKWPAFNGAIDKMSIEGSIGIFIDHAAGEGFTQVDPDYNQVGHANMVEHIAYKRFLEGDLERAKVEAEGRLAALLRNDTVAVYFDRASWMGAVVDSPTGNYRWGSGFMNFVAEFPYTYGDESSRQNASESANALLNDIRRRT